MIRGLGRLGVFGLVVFSLILVYSCLFIYSFRGGILSSARDSLLRAKNPLWSRWIINAMDYLIIDIRLLAPSSARGSLSSARGILSDRDG